MNGCDKHRDHGWPSSKKGWRSLWLPLTNKWEGADRQLINRALFSLAACELNVRAKRWIVRSRRRGSDASKKKLWLRCLVSDNLYKGAWHPASSWRVGRSSGGRDDNGGAGQEGVECGGAF